MPGDTIEQLERSGTHVVREWVGHVDKDDTDGQLAVAYAVAEYGCQSVLLYGGLPHPNGYEIDHFLGNLRLMRLGLRLFQENIHGDKHSWKAEMRDPLQTIHFVVSGVTLERKNDGVQRVSLISNDPNVTVEHSANLRWSLDGLHVDPVRTNALRNEFVEGLITRPSDSRKDRIRSMSSTIGMNSHSRITAPSIEFQHYQALPPTARAPAFLFCAKCAWR